MTDLKKEIPQRAFINAEILQIAESTGNFHQATQEITQKYGLNNYVYKNPAHIVSLLYCLLVVPKEIFVEKNEQAIKAINRRITAQEMAGFFIFNIDKKNVQTDTFKFLSRIRNSIAHANYEVDDNMTFTFRDRDLRSEPEGWGLEVTIERDKLMELLSKRGADLANLRTNPL